MSRQKITIDLERVQYLASRGLTFEEIAHNLGIGVSTLNRRREELEELNDAIKKGRSIGTETIANALFEKAIAGDTTAMIFYLKARAGWKEVKEAINVNIGNPTEETESKKPQGMAGFYDVIDSMANKRLEELKREQETKTN